MRTPARTDVSPPDRRATPAGGQPCHRIQLQPELRAAMTLAEAHAVAERTEAAVLEAIEPATTVTVVPSVDEPEPRRAP